MQASIHEFEDGAGTALLDDGRLITVPYEAFVQSALRHLRPGQRVSVTLDEASEPPVATKVWIVGIGEGEIIR